MNKNFKRISVVLAVSLIALLYSAAPAAAQTCEGVTDEQIVADVYSKLRSDKSLAGQLSHINVVSVFAAVKLQGWVNNRRDYDKATELVGATRCVRLINVNLFEDRPPDTTRGGAGCAAGTKPCGDICIPESDVCNITVARP